MRFYRDRRGHCLGIVAFLAAFILLPGLSHAQPAPISVCQLTQNRAAYDKKVIVVKGVVTDIKNRKAPSGYRYVIVQLKDVQGQCWVRLFFRHPQNFLTRGQTWDVLGRYFNNFRYFQWTFQNEVQPTEFIDGSCTRYLTQFGWAKTAGCP